MHYIGEVTIKFKNSVLEPQGKAIELLLQENEFTGFSKIRVGKFIELDLEAKDKIEAESKLRELAEELFYNPVMEIAQLYIREKE